MNAKCDACPSYMMVLDLTDESGWIMRQSGLLERPGKEMKELDSRGQEVDIVVRLVLLLRPAEPSATMYHGSLDSWGILEFDVWAKDEAV